ncbi:hypothetical protein EJB05_21053 [Eragrostis curvula]|uniref:Uncharacterized protein n=1 Tax=Eragrostis curvula TaxID=38414 RepID=A0A5J9V289_9POAL|nr:hypothetical protein EJB05_21053 [Eragrostis curvula]
MDQQGEPPVPAVIVNTEQPPPSLAAKILDESLQAALIAACYSAAFTAYNLVVGSFRPAGVGLSAALALLLEGCRSRQALAVVALKAAGANVWFNLKLMLMCRVEGPCQVLFAFDAASFVFLAALYLLGLLAVLMGEGEEAVLDQMQDPDVVGPLGLIG